MKLGKWLTLIVIVIGVWLMAKGGYMQAKAHLAQFLIADAWQKTLSEGGQYKPWYWADTYPVARLFLSSLSGTEVDSPSSLYVLAGAVGRTLAFGPGLLLSGARPGEGGNTVIAGHRDTHFTDLQHLKALQMVTMQIPSGVLLEYEIFDIGVYHESDAWLMGETEAPILTLITCYPFDALMSDTPYRFVVRARQVSN